jgi:tyrosine-specific transport protein
MATNILGRYGKVGSWIIFILLLYSLMAAYSSVGGEIIASAAYRYLGHNMPLWLGSSIWISLFATLIYYGMSLSEQINRLLVLGLAASFVALSATVTPHITPQLFKLGHWNGFILTLPVVTAAFGYHIIVPSIRAYLADQKKLLTWSITLGTFLPLCFYAIWVLLIFGTIPQVGEYGLSNLLQANQPVEQLIQAIAVFSPNTWTTSCVRFFTFFAITSSLIAVAIGLFDLLADGLSIKKDPLGRFTLVLMTFVPPFFYALFYPKGFLLALSYAGVFVALLHGILPALLVWVGRYQYWQQGKATYKVWGGKPALVTIIALSILVIIAEFGIQLHWF